MGKVRKGILIICLIYFLVGALEWVNLGTFLPPMAGKPFFFIGIIGCYLLGIWPRGKLSGIGIAMIIWIFTLAFSSLDFVELFFEYQFIKFYADFIAPTMRLISVISIIGLSILLYRKLKTATSLYFLPILLSSALVPAILLVEYHLIYEAGLVVIGLTYFVLSLIFRKDKQVEMLENEGLVLNGVTAILFMDQAAILLGLF